MLVRAGANLLPLGVLNVRRRDCYGRPVPVGTAFPPARCIVRRIAASLQGPVPTGAHDLEYLPPARSSRSARSIGSPGHARYMHHFRPRAANVAWGGYVPGSETIARTASNWCPGLHSSFSLAFRSPCRIVAAVMRPGSPVTPCSWKRRFSTQAFHSSGEMPPSPRAKGSHPNGA